MQPISRWLYGTSEASALTAEQQNTISAISAALGAAAGVATAQATGGGSTVAANIATGSQITHNAVENNALNGMPGNNQAQNKQFRAVVVQLKLTPDQSQQLHRAISGQNYTYHDILNEAKSMFGK